MQTLQFALDFTLLFSGLEQFLLDENVLLRDFTDVGLSLYDEILQVLEVLQLFF